MGVSLKSLYLAGGCRWLAQDKRRRVPRGMAGSRDGMTGAGKRVSVYQTASDIQGGIFKLMIINI